MYDISKLGKISGDFATALANRPDNLQRIDCSGPEGARYAYDTTEGLDTIVNQVSTYFRKPAKDFKVYSDLQWNLVCDRLPLLSTIQGSYMGGVFVGCMIWGWASDKYGRRLAMLVAAALQVVSSITATWATNYVVFIFLRFLIAFSVSGVFECGFVLGKHLFKYFTVIEFSKEIFAVTEICGPKYRTYFGILTQFPFGIGAALLPLIAYFIRNWQNLQLAISVPCLLLALYYW